MTNRQTVPKTMRAFVLEKPGPPEALKLRSVPVPVPKAGELLIRVRAFGLNRSELFTRQGHSPSVTLPRILGIEAVGEVAAAPGGEFEPGQAVATAMGGLGRQFDGSYAEYTCVPASQVQELQTTLEWPRLAALPEMLQTAWGSLHTALRVERGQSLLVRGGTTSVGLAAANLAKRHGLQVAATSRKPEREDFLRRHGADEVFIDSGSISDRVREVFPGGVDRVLELVGTTTLLDSLQAANEGGVVCMTGMVGNAWELERFSPMDSIPTAVRLTTYSGGVEDFLNTPLQELVLEVEASRLMLQPGTVFDFEDTVEAHRTMENNLGGGKLVVVIH